MKLRYNQNFPDSVCEIEGCDEIAKRIIRTKLVCGRCYSILLRDNFLKFNNGIEITKDLNIQKSCYKYRCGTKMEVEFKYTIVNGKKELLPKFCSENCKLLDDNISQRRGIR